MNKTVSAAKRFNCGFFIKIGSFAFLSLLVGLMLYQPEFVQLGGIGFLFSGTLLASLIDFDPAPQDAAHPLNPIAITESVAIANKVDYSGSSLDEEYILFDLELLQLLSSQQTSRPPTLNAALLESNDFFPCLFFRSVKPFTFYRHPTGQFLNTTQPARAGPQLQV
ncbi:MAG: hypothetical protein E7056_02475 [Lentisphaerae bacterium]|nr:hypothetical protein [Lentisphaerota bacterium]